MNNIKEEYLILRKTGNNVVLFEQCYLHGPGVMAMFRKEVRRLKGRTAEATFEARH